MHCYFHLVKGRETIPDEAGIEVADIEIAQLEALKAVQELRREEGQIDAYLKGWRLNVVDASGNLLLSIRLDTPLP
jgi:hypothetical protein